MGSDLLSMIYILAAGIGVFFIVFTIFAKNEDSKSLSWASGNEPVKSASGLIELSRTLTHQFTIQHSPRVKSVDYRKKVAFKIMTAGLGSVINVDEFIGMQILWGIMFPILLIILNFALQLGYPWPICIGLGLVGWQFPNFHCNAERAKRAKSVQRDLPFFIDLLALATEAGLDFPGAIQRIVEKSRGKSVLADELDNVLRDIVLGSARSQALKGLAHRLDIPEINSFVNVVIDADSTGTSVTKVLKEQSEQMRLERFVRAEKEGAKASQKILIPLMLFILPAVFIMVFAPVALQFIYPPKQ